MNDDKKISTYEISFLANSLEDASVVKDLLQKLQAEIVNEGPISEIQLAYPIEKKTSAVFGYIHFKLPAEDAPKITETLTLEKKIMRFLVITPVPQKPVPRRVETSARTAKKVSQGDLSNEALEEKLAALQESK